MNNLDDHVSASTLIVCSMYDDAARAAVALSWTMWKTLFVNSLTHQCQRRSSSNTLFDVKRNLFICWLTSGDGPKKFPNYDDVASELRVLEQFQDRQWMYIKEMLAHNEYCTFDEFILAISRYKDKLAGKWPTSGGYTAYRYDTFSWKNERRC